MYHIEKNTVQETLIIPLFGRKVCSEHFPHLKTEIEAWSSDFASVTARSYMRGYRDIYNEVGLFHKLMIKFCDSMVKMQIIKVMFG